MSYGSWSSIFSKTVWKATSNNITVYDLTVRYRYRQDADNLKSEVYIYDITLKQHISGWGMSGYTFTGGTGFSGNYTKGSKSISGNPPNSFVIDCNKTQVVNHDTETGAASVKIWWYGYTDSEDIYRPKQYDWTYFTATLPTLSVIPKITSVVNFTDEGSPVINYENSLGNSITSLESCIGYYDSNNSWNYICNYRGISKTGTSYTYNLTDSEKQLLYKATKNTKTLNINYYIRYQIGTSSKKEIYKTAIASIVNAEPVIGNISYIDENDIYQGTDGYWIFQNISNLSINIENISYKKSNSSNPVTLSYCTFTTNGITKGTTDITNNINFGSIDINSDMTLTGVIKVTDSRGFTSSKNVSIIYKAYNSPAIKKAEIKRQNGYSETTTIKISSTYTDIEDVTNLEIKYRYKNKTDTSWSSYTTIQNNTEYTIDFIFLKDNIYDFDISVTDGLKTVEYYYILNKAVFPLFIDTLNNSVGVNCLPSEKALEIDGDMAVTGDYYLNDGTTVKSNIDGLSANITNLNTSINSLQNDKLDKDTIKYEMVSNSSGTTVTSGKYVSICSITLPAGLWIVKGTINFAANTSGYRAVDISPAVGWNSVNATQVSAASSGGTYITAIDWVNPSTTTTYYLVASQNSGSSLTVKGYFKALRIK